MFSRSITDVVNSALAFEERENSMTKGHIVTLWLREVNMIYTSYYKYESTKFSLVQSLSRVRLFVTLWIASNSGSGYFSLCKQRNCGIPIKSQRLADKVSWWRIDCSDGSLYALSSDFLVLYFWLILRMTNHIYFSKNTAVLFR